jgi:hypothetical protein
MNNWLKISEDTFYTYDCSVQLSMENYATIYISLDLKRHPAYCDIILDIYENKKTFSITTSTFFAKQCRIKTIDVDFGKKMSISIRCESIDAHDISERRDSIIDDILGNRLTFIGHSMN